MNEKDKSEEYYADLAEHRIGGDANEDHDQMLGQTSAAEWQGLPAQPVEVQSQAPEVVRQEEEDEQATR